MDLKCELFLLFEKSFDLVVRNRRVYFAGYIVDFKVDGATRNRTVDNNAVYVKRADHKCA